MKETTKYNFSKDYAGTFTNITKAIIYMTFWLVKFITRQISQVK